MRHYSLYWLVILVAAAAEWAFAAGCEVELAIRLPAEVVPTREGYVKPDDITVTLRNVGKRAVTLVHPGDGSAGNRRTPKVAWLVDGKINSIDVGFCGNVNALKSEEVFELRPGEAVRLAAWIPALYLKEAGAHEVQLSYRNDPALEISGIPLGRHDPDALRRMRSSTPCDVQSNTAVVNVAAPTP